MTLVPDLRKPRSYRSFSRWFSTLLLFVLPSIAFGASLTAEDFDESVAAAERMPRLRSLLVSHGDELILERYFNGATARRAGNIKSVSKTVMSALVGLAVKEGHLDGLDQPIAEFYPDYPALAAEPRKQKITIGDLLSMRAGLETTSFYNYGAWVLSDDWVRYALDQPLRAEPGGRLLYSTGNTHLLSAILTQATGESTLAFARRHLSAPLGFRLPAWTRDPQGVYMGGNNMEFTPRQMLAFGQMYLNEGNYAGRQVVPQDWVRLSLEPQVESPREAGRYYGYGWWVRSMAGFEAPYAWGYGGQFIVLVPALEMVIVATSSSEPDGRRRRHTRAMYDLLEHGIVAPAADALQEYRPVPRVGLETVGSSAQ